MLRVVWRCVRFVALAYVAVILFLMFFEESMIFPARRYPAGDWDAPYINREEVSFEAEDGVKLHGWYLEHPRAKTHLLYCHGNAEHIADVADLLDELRRKHQASVFVFDYRGYGKSEGKPKEKGVLTDGRAAHQWLVRRTGLPADRLVLMGRSLGGAVAVDLAAEYGAAGLILENTFSSMPDVAASYYPWLPVRRLIRTQFDSKAKINRYTGPLLQTHGDADEIVPIEFGQRLFNAAVSEDKRFIVAKGGRHNEFPCAEYEQALGEFLSDPKPR